MEEPLPPENLDAWVELKRSTRTPIATGERYVARFQFRELLEKYCCDYIQPDAIYTGGMNELRKIAAMAEAYYCPVVPHNCNGPVCTAASIHAAACMPNFRMLEYIPVHQSAQDVLVGAARHARRGVRVADETGSRRRAQQGGVRPLCLSAARSRPFHAGA